MVQLKKLLNFVAFKSKIGWSEWAEFLPTQSIERFFNPSLPPSLSCILVALYGMRTPEDHVNGAVLICMFIYVMYQYC